MGHIVLLGDSIFDNASYVPGELPIIEQLRQALPSAWDASLLAIDGDTAEDVAIQISRLPPQATHVFVSVGGNDALLHAQILDESAGTVGHALELLDQLQSRFRLSYRAMLKSVFRVRKPVTLCTVYDTIPGITVPERAALAGFNEVILREAVLSGVPLIDLRIVCDGPEDYSRLSSIEPSAAAGLKIVKLIVEIAQNHPFEKSRTVIYT